MNTSDRKQHWEKVFETKDTKKVSWYQPVPSLSLELIEEVRPTKETQIIEIGCGDSYLGDFLLENGFSNITLLDISEKALEAIKLRLQDKSGSIRFLAKDITGYSSPNSYDIWHDRAVFHFLTKESDIKKYVQNASESIKTGGYLIIGTFSNEGPKMCSDLQVQQYSEKELVLRFQNDFDLVRGFTENHTTPSGSIQNFLFCIFRKK